jgi:hypothetical protein
MQCPACGSHLGLSEGGWCGRCGWKKPRSTAWRGLLVAAAVCLAVVLVAVILFAATASSRRASRQAALDLRAARDDAARAKKARDDEEKKKAAEAAWFKKQDEDAKLYDRRHPSGAAPSTPSSAASPDKPNAAICPRAAERAIKRMAACGFNVDGITPQGMCEESDYGKLSFLGSRSCDEVRSILNGSGK